MQIFPLPSEGEGWGEGEKMKSGYKWMRLLRHCAPRNDKSLSSHEYRVSSGNKKSYTRIRTGNEERWNYAIVEDWKSRKDNI